MGRWCPAPDETSYAVVTYQYEGKENPEQCLPLELGDRVYIYEETEGWYKGCLAKNQKKKGIFPRSYVKVKPSFVERHGNQKIISPNEDCVAEEAKLFLREWHEIWKQLFLNPYKDIISTHDGSKVALKNNLEVFEEIRKIMTDIIKCLCSNYLGVLGQDQLKEKKKKITSLIDKGNRILGLDMVPRDEDGNKVNPVTCAEKGSDQKGVLELYDIHNKMYQGYMNPDTTCTPDAVKKSQSIHLLFGISQCVLLLRTPVDVYVSLYDYKEDRFISERFLACLTENGVHRDNERLHDVGTLFTDLSLEDLERDLFIVCQFYRLGPLTLETNKNQNKNGREYLRPLGVSYVSIRNHVEQAEGNSQLRVRPVERLDIYRNKSDRDESNFIKLHRQAISGERIHFHILDSNQGLYISNLKIFHGELPKLIQQNPHLLRKTHDIKTRKLGFPAIIYPGDKRNDLYITLKEAKFVKDRNKNAERNILVTLCVKDENGATVKGCIFRGTGEHPVDEYQSSVIYHENHPHWGETVRINLPDDQMFTSCHILITFRHCNNKTKNKDRPGFSFLKLANPNGTLISNDDHKLVVYKDVQKNAEFKFNTSEYINLPAYTKDINISKDTTVHEKSLIQKYSEYMLISSVFCSTSLTQNNDLKLLLQWRSHPNQLEQVLRNVEKIPGEEMVKFLQHIFESLFYILEDHSDKYGELVFNCIVQIICTLADHKFQHFRPVLDSYIRDHFFYTRGYVKLLDCLKRCMVDAKNKSGDNTKIGSIMKALEYLFKFIVQSCKLHTASATLDRSYTGFRNSLLGFFEDLNKMIQFSTSPFNTAFALKYFPDIIPELLKVLPLDLTCKIIEDFVNSVNQDGEKDIINYKLKCINSIVNGPVLEEPEGCDLMMPLLMGHLRLHLKPGSSPEEKELAIKILTHILITVANKHSNSSVVKKVVEPMLEMLFRLVCQVNKTTHPDLARDYVSCLIALLHLMKGEHYKAYMDIMVDHEFITFLNEVFTVFGDLVKDNIYFQDWIVMSMLQSYVILTAIGYFSKSLTELLTRPNSQDYMQRKDKLWRNFFALCVGFITQDTLQLEKFSEAKRLKISEQYGDMRVEMGDEMVRMWRQLGDNKIRFIPDMVGLFVQVTLVPLESLRKSVIPIFFDLIECEFDYRGNFNPVEKEVIDKLDIFISEGKGDNNYRMLMYEILIKKCTATPKRQLSQNAIRFVNSINLLLGRLLALRDVREGDQNREARMICILNLLDFYKELSREEMYMRYIFKLYHLHKEQKNYVEAAFTLDLYAEKLLFDDTVLVEAFEQYPKEPQSIRKAVLYKEIIELFRTGQSFENTFRLYKELADYYEESYDYNSLAHMLREQADCYEKILSEIRYETEYFYIGFYGMGFPEFLRNKAYIYRGKVLDRLSSAQIRFQDQFPKATLLNYTYEPDATVKGTDDQFLQMFKVYTLNNSPEFDDKVVPTQITEFYANNNVNVFYYNKTFSKTANKVSDSDFGSQWLEKTYYHTADHLPGKLRLTLIFKSEREEISPINNAIETMQTKNKDLKKIFDSFKDASTEKNPNPLTMALNGTVDAVVSGGIKMYEEAFFTETYILKNPADSDNVKFLKQEILDQVGILQEGIDIHKKVCSPAMMPLHERIEMLHDQMRNETNVYRRDLGHTPIQRCNTFRPSSGGSVVRNPTLPRLPRHPGSRTSVVSLTSNGLEGSPPPPLPDRRPTEVHRSSDLPDPKALVNARRAMPQSPSSPINNQNIPSDQPALPPKKRSSVIQNSPTHNQHLSMSSPNDLIRSSDRSIGSNNSFNEIQNSNNSIDNDESLPLPLPPRNKFSASSPPVNTSLTDDGDLPPPIPSRSNSQSRPPKAPRDRSITLPEQ